MLSVFITRKQESKLLTSTKSGVDTTTRADLGHTQTSSRRSIKGAGDDVSERGRRCVIQSLFMDQKLCTQV